MSLPFFRFSNFRPPFLYLPIYLISFIFYLTFTTPTLASHLPVPTGFVNDFTGILSSEQKNDLETLLSNSEKRTTNQITIALVKNLNGGDIDDFTVRAFEEWQVGKKGKDNGVLLLIAIDDRKLRIEVGYGLEPKLTDSQAGEIIRNTITPEFKKGNYYQGIKEGLNAIVAQLEGNAPSPNPSAKEDNSSFASRAVILFFGFWLFATFFLRIFHLLGKLPGIWAGPIGGLLAGGVVGLLAGSLLTLVILALSFGLIGLILDILASTSYTRLSQKQRHTFWGQTLGYWGSFGPRTGSSGSAGFGGFGGGSSGGGGGSGSW